MKLRILALIGLLGLSGGWLSAPAWAQGRAVLSAFRDVVTEASKSTVEVYAKGQKTPPVALGTIVAADGFVLTKGSQLPESVECKLADGRRLEATLVGKDKQSDLAMLKVDAKDLPVVQWRDGDPPPVGSWLATPGYSDAKPQPFPIAIGVLSVATRKIPAPPAAMGVDLDEREDVAMIKSVRPGTPAEAAGIEAGDIIKKVNDKEIKGRIDLVTTVRKFQPGDKITLVVERDGKDLTIEVVLASFSVILSPGGIDRADMQNHLGGELSERRAGFPSAIQHDTVLKPTECGGPIVDLDGKAVGINIARAGRVESFALPASFVKSLLPDLMSGKLNPKAPAETVADGAKPDGTNPVTTEEKKVQ